MKKQLLRWIALAAILVSSILPAPMYASEPRPPDPPNGDQPARVESVVFEPLPTPKAPEKSIAHQDHAPSLARVFDDGTGDDEALAVYIIQLSDPPVASYLGGVDGLAPTAPRALNTRKLDAESASSRAYRAYLQQRQAEVLSRVAEQIGRTPAVRFTYSDAINGFAVHLTRKEVATLVTMDGVVGIYRDILHQPTTDQGPTWIGAPGIWDGSNTMGLPATRGEGVVVGVIDTGINMDHPSFADVGDDGYDHSNPKGRFFGVCDPGASIYNPNFTCNDKLIGAWDFADDGYEVDGPEDSDGHGSHTASTAAGNVLNSATLSTTTYVFQTSISGVAPHANIISYDACMANDCWTSSLVMAINQAVIDGVDVINFSIGGGSYDPWGSSDAIAFLGAVDAGVVPAVSAGNAGPEAYTIGSPANAPWVTGVAAATHTRKPLNGLVNLSGGDTAAPANIQGQSLTGGYGPARIVYAGDVPNGNDGYYPSELCAAPYPAGTFNGEIVVCDRGLVGRVAKGENVAAGGAGGMVLANDAAAAASLISDPHVLPAVQISFADGEVLKTWLSSGADHTATILGTTMSVADVNGDVIAGFSSRGPDRSVPDVLKPNLAAPGVDVFAALKDGEEFGMASGTSMAGPHVAGAAALLTALYPSWSPTAIQSALMLSARTENVRSEDGVSPATPLDRGAGRVDLTRAAKVGFVLEETAANFAAAAPYNGGEPKQLNLAGLSEDRCLITCSWTRTLTSVKATAVQYSVSSEVPFALTVEPANFVLAPGGAQQITITADLKGLPFEAWHMGHLIFTADDSSIPVMSMPVAAYADAGNLPASVEIPTRRNQSSYLIRNLEMIGVPNLQTSFRLAQPEHVTGAVMPDETQYFPFDDLDQVFVYSMTLPVDAIHLNVAIVESTAPDLDLFVGVDSNGNGLPDSGEVLCAATSGWSSESCDISQQDLSDLATLNLYDFWFVVQNWAGSGSQSGDTFQVGVSILDKTGSQFGSVIAPSSISTGTPFDLRLLWNVPDFAPSQQRIGLVELVDGDTSMSLGRTFVRLFRLTNELQETYTADTGVVVPGSILSYLVEVNPEPTAANEGLVNYVITKTLAAGLTYVPNSSSTPPINVTDNQMTWSIQEGSIEYTVKVDNTISSYTVLTSTLTADIDHPHTVPIQQNEPLAVTDVAVDIDMDVPRSSMSSIFTYTLTVQNHGIRAANNLTVETVMPFATQYVRGGTLQPNGKVTWRIDSLSPAQPRTFHLVVEANEGLTPAASSGRQIGSPNIVGGNPADPGEYPWQVALVRAGWQAFDGQFCGGSLLDENWVLTAAHCVEGATPSIIEVIAGIHDLTTNGGQRIGVSQIIIHPNYNSYSADSDVALLRLSAPAQFSTMVQPIGLTSNAHATLFQPGTIATVTGWGTLNYGWPDYPDVLYEVGVAIVTNKVCSAAYDPLFGRGSITPTMMCAGFAEGGKDACQGDSGGPMIVSNGQNGWLQVGIVSWGEGCGKPGYPGVYASVPALYGWIMGPATRQVAPPSYYRVTDGSNRSGYSAEGSPRGSTLVGWGNEIFMPVIAR